MACKFCNQNPFGNTLDTQGYDPFVGTGITRQSFDPFNPNTTVHTAPIVNPVQSTSVAGTPAVTPIGVRTSHGSGSAVRSATAPASRPIVRFINPSGDGTIRGLFTGEIMVGIMIGIILMSIDWKK